MNIKRLLLTILPALTLSAVSCGCSGNGGKTPGGDTDPNFKRYTSGLSFTSAVLGENVSFAIMLPASYVSSPQKSYPVVYMFHGLGDKPESWNDKWLNIESKVKELEQGGLEEMIYVFPQGFKSYYVNRYTGAFNYMDMLVNEFIPYIDKTYRTKASREFRAVTGYSMGGFGAMAVAMKHPELFVASAPLSMSFRTDSQYMAESQDGWNGQWGMVFGGIGSSGEARLTDYYKEYSPFYQFVPSNKEALSKIRWFFTCGDDEEQLLIAGDDLHVQMRDALIPHEWRVKDGAHTGSYWRLALNEVLPFFSSCFAGEKTWDWSTVKPDVPEISLAADGTFASEGFISGGNNGGTAVYLAHDGIDAGLLKSAVAIIQRGSSSRKFMILPCNTAEKDLEAWVEAYESAYKVGGTPENRVVIAVGGAGAQAYASSGSFSRLLFENADLGVPVDDVEVSPERFWYMGLTDEDVNYAFSNALYKACKRSGAKFEYRTRNARTDPDTSFLEGFETMRIYVF